VRQQCVSLCISPPLPTPVRARARMHTITLTLRITRRDIEALHRRLS